MLLCHSSPNIKDMSRHAIPNRRRNETQRPRRRWTERFGLDVLRARWKNSMPKFFRVICWVCALVSGTALAVNTAIVAGGGVPHTWWSDIYPYLLGIPAGAAFVCKFTQQYSGKPIDIDEQRRASQQGRTILDRDIDHMHAESPNVGDEIPADITEQ